MYNNVFSKFFDFKKNLFGILSLLYITFIFFISIFTYFIAPDSSSNSNNMNVSIHSKEPGFKIDILEIDEDTTSQSFFDLFLFGSKKKMFGTNPISFGAPTKFKYPFIFDSSMSIINRGKIRLAAKQKKNIPYGVALDKSGKTSINLSHGLSLSLSNIG